MRRRPHKFLLLFMAFLCAVPCLAPSAGQAEAQMRCAGTASHSAPCARVTLPAGGMNKTQIYAALMSCCRARMQGCPMRHSSPRMAGKTTGTHRATLSVRRCLVSVRTAAPVPASLAVRRALRVAYPVLAPPAALSAAPVLFPCPVRVTFWTRPPALSPHAAPALHGLRAPPTA